MEKEEFFLCDGWLEYPNGAEGRPVRYAMGPEAQ
jgi:hypothetical protein